MKTHNGMRPQDIIILLKLTNERDLNLSLQELSASLCISASEISESIQRSTLSGLLEPGTRKVNKERLLRFIEYGLPYVFPAQIGSPQQGMYTAHSESSLFLLFSTEDKLVWADNEGTQRGSSITPLYPTVTKAVKKDKLLYKLLALCDIVRVGNSADRSKAIWHLKEIFERGA